MHGSCPAPRPERPPRAGALAATAAVAAEKAHKDVVQASVNDVDYLGSDNMGIHTPPRLPHTPEGEVNTHVEVPKP